jgi:hypothetical protein
MTKFFDARVELVRRKTTAVQIAAESESEATALAASAAVAKEPEFSPTGKVDLKLVGESEIKVGSRVFHRLFGAGIVEQVAPSAPSGFSFTIKFDKGETKNIHGPGAVLRPEELADHDPRSYPNYKATFRWDRIGDTLDVVGTATNTRDRVDPALFEVLMWCRENIEDGNKSTVEVKYEASINDEATGIHHWPHMTYKAKITFSSGDSLTRFLLMWKD